MSGQGAWGIPTYGDPKTFLPHIIAVLIDRAGGQITLSPADIERMAYMKPELEFSVELGIHGDITRIRYCDRVTVDREVTE